MSSPHSLFSIAWHPNMDTLITPFFFSLFLIHICDKKSSYTYIYMAEFHIHSCHTYIYVLPLPHLPTDSQNLPITGPSTICHPHPNPSLPPSSLCLHPALPISQHNSPTPPDLIHRQPTFHQTWPLHVPRNDPSTTNCCCWSKDTVPTINVVSSIFHFSF